MRSLLIVVTVASIFTACRSNVKTDKETVGTDSSIGLVDSSAMRALPDGTRRVTVVQKLNADGSRSVTTTTDINTNTTSNSARKSSAASSAGTQPVAGTVPVATEKKGWSKRAKGAVIGGVGGAAVGAVVSKNKVAGAVIGSAIGAGGGYIIGNETDKKTIKK